MSGKLRRIRGSGNVFLDLGFDMAEAGNLKLRSELMIRIEEFLRLVVKKAASRKAVHGLHATTQVVVAQICKNVARMLRAAAERLRV
jgi:predicted XRE-type DNA-binding protein